MQAEGVEPSIIPLRITSPIKVTNSPSVDIPDFQQTSYRCRLRNCYSCNHFRTIEDRFTALSDMHTLRKDLLELSNPTICKHHQNASVITRITTPVLKSVLSVVAGVDLRLGESLSSAATGINRLLFREFNACRSPAGLPNRPWASPRNESSPTKQTMSNDYRDNRRKFSLSI